MSVVTTSTLKVAPSSAAALAVKTGGSAWAYGAWVQVIAATGNPAQIAGFVIHPNDTWSNLSIDVEVGIGLVGLESAVGSPMRIGLGNSGGGAPVTYMLPAPVIDQIPLGAAVSLRTRSNATNSTFDFAFLYYEGLDSDHGMPYGTIAYPTAATLAVVTPSGVAWTNSAKAVLSASLTNNAYVYGLEILVSNVSQDFEFDIMIGGAGSEVKVTTLPGGTARDAGRIEYYHLSASLLIAAGTRVTVQQRGSSTSTSTFGVALLAYDAPAPAATPSPASDYPCGIKTPVFWSAISVGGSVIRAAKQPLRNASTYLGGYTPPRLESIGTVSRVASDWQTGAWQGQTASMRWIDFDHFMRTLSRPSTLNSQAYLYLQSEVTRLAGGNPALLFHGPIYDDPMTEHLTSTFQINDYISVDYNLFKDDKLIPQRTVSQDDFPNRPFGSEGLGVPIIGGSVSDEGGLATGLIKAINAGTLVIGGTTYAVALVAGHACAGGIINAYQAGAALTWGTKAFAPGKTSWTTVQASGALFFDINGNRYTPILLPTAQSEGTAFLAGDPIYVNTLGMEPNGDGTGSVITDLFTLEKYLMVQWITQSYRSGSWLTGRSFEFYPGDGTSIPIVDEASYTAASTTAGTYLGGGFIGGFVIGANGVRRSVRDIIKQMNVSGNVLMYLNGQSQIAVKMFATSRSTFLGSTRTITDKRDILKNPAFSMSHRVDWFANDLGYQYAENYRDDNTGQWNSSNSRGHAPSVVKYGVVTGRRTYSLIRDDATADAVSGQQLAFAGPDPPRLIRWAQSLCGMGFDVCSGIPITHYAGVGANGCVNNGVWIISQQLDPSNCTVMFQGIDVEALLA